MRGLHLTADLSGCLPGASMTDAETLRTLCRQATQAAGLRPVGELFHGFGPGAGVTGVVLLAESHLAVHTWPELGAVTLDVYVCNLATDHGDAAAALLDTLIAVFSPRGVTRQRLQRGELGGDQAGRPSAAAQRAPTSAPQVNASSNTE